MHSQPKPESYQPLSEEIFSMKKYFYHRDRHRSDIEIDLKKGFVLPCHDHWIPLLTNSLLIRVIMWLFKIGNIISFNVVNEKFWKNEISLYLNFVHLYTNQKGILVIVLPMMLQKCGMTCLMRFALLHLLPLSEKNSRHTYSPKPIHHNIFSVSSCCLRGVDPCYVPQLWLYASRLCLLRLRVCLMTEIKRYKSIRLDYTRIS